MAEEVAAISRRFAVVTGSNKGIGFEVCRQLAYEGIVVVLTAREEKKGIEALEKLKSSSFSDYVMFHQLNVMDPSSIASLADFVKTQFGKLDILVNNAGTSGAIVDWDALKLLQAAASEYWVVSLMRSGGQIDMKDVTKQTLDLSKECLDINYYGAKRMIEAFIPLLELSDSPRIVNVSSSLGELQNIPGKEIKGMLSNVEILTETKINELLDEFLKDFKEGSLEAKGWPQLWSAYIISKAVMNVYTRILAKRYPTFHINCVCPGFVKTDINGNTGYLSIEEGAASPVKLALMPDDGPSGVSFYRHDVSPF